MLFRSVLALLLRLLLLAYYFQLILLLYYCAFASNTVSPSPFIAELLVKKKMTVNKDVVSHITELQMKMTVNEGGRGKGT